MFSCRKKDGNSNYYLSEFPDEECLATTHWMLLCLACLGILILIPLTFLAQNPKTPKPQNPKTPPQNPILNIPIFNLSSHYGQNALILSYIIL